MGFAFHFAVPKRALTVHTAIRPHRGDSNENIQYTIFNMKKKNHPQLSQICSYGIFFSKTFKNEFETTVVNEPSVFQPLKVYCNSQHCATLLRERKLIIQKNKQIK